MRDEPSEVAGETVLMMRAGLRAMLAPVYVGFSKSRTCLDSGHFMSDMSE